MATWGSQTWGYQNWGTLGDQTVTLTGISASSNIGTLTTDTEVNKGWGSDTWGRGSSVELLLDDVDRHVECMGGQDHGYPEGVAVPQEGQQVGGSGLAHR